MSLGYPTWWQTTQPKRTHLGLAALASGFSGESTLGCGSGTVVSRVPPRPGRADCGGPTVVQVVRTASPTWTYSPPQGLATSWQLLDLDEHSTVPVKVSSMTPWASSWTPPLIMSDGSAHGTRGSRQSTGPSLLKLPEPSRGAAPAPTNVLSPMVRWGLFMSFTLNHTGIHLLIMNFFCVWYLPCNCLSAANCWKL